MNQTILLRLAAAVLLGVQLTPTLSAAGPDGTPEQTGIKSAVGVDAGLFARQLKLVEERRAGWLAAAASATPKLLHKTMKPVALVKVQKHAASFQGWKMVAGDQPESVCNKPLLPGAS
ncbi:MAG: hypothetical protein NTZ16_06730 [Verrucomicrobia bacterium]|nr:hypothetical protein [Verrucomicrobiota bacterium]